MWPASNVERSPNPEQRLTSQKHVGEEYRFWTKKKLSDVGDFMACQRNSKHMGLTLPQSEKDDLIDLRQAN